MSSKYLKKAVEISLKTGGCIKFDIKAFDGNLYFILTGSSNKNTLKNFKTASKFISKRKNPPLVIASTLLVPGYIDEIEIKKISEFIYDCSPDIPYKLLGFHPQFYMSDLPPTSKKFAYSCLETAKRCGLTNVDIGNRNLLL
jgi:pyruvate formate lyase activating enzyme